MFYGPYLFMKCKKRGGPGKSGSSPFFAKLDYAGITLIARSFALFLGSGSVSNVTF